MQIQNLRHRLTLLVKSLLYKYRGEPYRIKGETLRYLPGTRPVRLKYLNSSNVNVRNDAWQIKIFAENIQEGDTCVDIGAHVGQYSVLMAALCGKSGQVYSFEPDPYARQLFERNLTLNPQIKRPVIESFACSDTIGEAILFSKQGNSQSSLARTALESDEKRAEEVAIQTTTIDQYIQTNKMPVPSWVKIDTEGAEIRILSGAKSLLESEAQIICELHPYAWPDFNNTYSELLEIVHSAGRRMILLSTGEPAPDIPEYSTVLIVNR